MGIVNVKESWSGRTAFDNRDGSSYRWGAVRIYTVLCDVPTSPAEVLLTATLPVIGEIHPTFTSAYCVGKEAEPIGPMLVQVICRYEGKDSPLSMPSERWFEGVSSTEPVDTDAAGVAIKNPLGRVYEGLNIEWQDLVFVRKINLASYPLSTVLTYMNSVNSDQFVVSANRPGQAGDWITVEPGQARYVVPQAQWTEDPGYWTLTQRILLREDGWQLRLPCRGPTYWDGNFDDPPANTIKHQVRAEDNNRRPIAGLVRLGATGLKLDESDPDVFQDFDVYAERAYLPLDLNS